jgi:hypothetical protein
MSQGAVVRELGQPASATMAASKTEGFIYLLLYRTSGTNDQLIVEFSESLGNEQILRKWCVVVPSQGQSEDTMAEYIDASAAWWSISLHFGCHEVQ